MRAIRFAVAVAAALGVYSVAAPAPAAALPLGAAAGLSHDAFGDEGRVQQVHGWHCVRAWSPNRGWHRHRRACGYYGYGYGYYGPGVGIYVGPGWGYGYRGYWGRPYYRNWHYRHRWHGGWHGGHGGWHGHRWHR